MCLTKKKTFTRMFECHILMAISYPMSILLAIKTYFFGIAFGLVPSFTPMAKALSFSLVSFFYSLSFVY